ncbi:amino acid ABC transporter substrate-binding protein [Thermodesulfomicrobium sp. WS]|jgi:polar amino acid transport system substrate-binding protein|uniref:ABC transporter substrate-binding protein n=1 Tax=Thermodesulfomicrobium sp. WS TaxID=3004129 RepID=UPI002492E091|nr:ABC transporter substrate-binding protein [Thermodesulfomicrobium sp. WS]BDV00803.1 amino acid ABC transporter substrate-binding protein [Thermodesulfomicrobium sp. WS]
MNGFWQRTLVILAALALGASAAHAGKLDEVKSRGKLIAGVKDSQPPFGYVDEQTRQIVGFEIDICAALAKKLGVGLELKPVTSATRIPMLEQGAIDLIAATMTHKIEREEKIDFSITYFPATQKLLVHKDSGIKSVADLAGKKVGSAKGSTSEQNIKKAQPECTVVSFETYPEAFLALKQGKVAAVTTDAPILLGIRNSDDHPEQWIIVGEDIAAEPYGIGLPENDSDFRDFVNITLMEMWKSGEYQQIYAKWFGPDTKFPLPLNWTMEIWP